MESASETNSIRSSKTQKKQVGFARNRPTLIIPPPQAQKWTQPYTASSGPTPQIYVRKQSIFQSGLGVGEKCAYCVYNKLRGWSRKWFTHMFLTVVLLLYTVGGALVFQVIEGQAEKSVESDLQNARNDLLKELRRTSLRMPAETTLEEWIGEASRHIQNRYEKKLENHYSSHKLAVITDINNTVWTFLNSVFYCATVYTSIGYGHIYPETKTGKALTIVYAIIGIPLFLLALTDFGKLFTRCIKFLWSFVRRLYYTGSCRQVRKTAHMKELVKGAQMMYEIATFRRPSIFANEEHPDTPSTDQMETPAISNFEIDDEFNLPISLAIFILLIYIFLGGLIYWLWEGWGFFDSFYFVFISMSTVGFGDMVPKNAACMIVSIVYLVFGLALMSMCINVVQDKLSDTFKQASTKIGATIGISVADDDGSVTTVPPENVEVPEVHETNEDNES